MATDGHGDPGPYPEDEQPEEELTDEQRAQMAAAFQQMMTPPQAWRPACAPCLSNHKIAIAEVSGKLKANGIVPGTPEFIQAMQDALRAGSILAQDPTAVLGNNGSKPDVIPPVREADVLVNGNSVCLLCFQPAPRQTGLLAAGPGMGGFRG